MGCFSSKDAKEDEKKIDYHFDTTHLTNMDAFFRKVKYVLEGLEDIRSGLEDNRDDLINDTFAQYLQEPSFKVAIALMFDAISANHDGKISNAEPKVEHAAPYINLSLRKMRHEVGKCWDYFHDYIKTICEGPSKIEELLKDFQNLLEEGPGLLDGAADEAKNSDLNPMKKAQAGLTSTKNFNKLKKQQDKVKRVKTVLTEAKDEMNGLLDAIKDSIAKADVVGAKAHSAGHVLPKAIFENYCELPKKSKEEIAAMEKKK